MDISIQGKDYKGKTIKIADVTFNLAAYVGASETNITVKSSKQANNPVARDVELNFDIAIQKCGARLDEDDDDDRGRSVSPAAVASNRPSPFQPRRNDAPGSQVAAFGSS